MSIYIYPAGWTESVEPQQVVLTEQERADLKAAIKGWLDAKPGSFKIALKKLVDKCENHAVTIIGKHVSQADLVNICMEIREQNGYPVAVIEEPPE
jgi:hypothetical protein